MLVLWGVLWTALLRRLGVRINYQTIWTNWAPSVMWTSLTRIQVTFSVTSRSIRPRRVDWRRVPLPVPQNNSGCIAPWKRSAETQLIYVPLLPTPAKSSEAHE